MSIVNQFFTKRHAGDPSRHVYAADMRVLLTYLLSGVPRRRGARFAIGIATPCPETRNQRNRPHTNTFTQINRMIVVGDAHPLLVGDAHGSESRTPSHSEMSRISYTHDLHHQLCRRLRNLDLVFAASTRPASAIQSVTNGRGLARGCRSQHLPSRAES